ncbi:MAG: hypothetical protein JO356_06965 [Acidobacteria bacterium]|nr:hypothetical protein [Acidobacteriota bacterium]
MRFAKIIGRGSVVADALRVYWSWSLPVVYFVLALWFLGVSYASGEVPAACKETDFKIATPNLIAIKCEENDVSGLVGTGQMYDSAMGLSVSAANVSVFPYPAARKWLVLQLSSVRAPAAPFSLQWGKKYKLSLLLHDAQKPIAPDITPTTFDLDVSNTVVVSPAIAVSSKNQYEFISHIAYKKGPNGLCHLQVEDYAGKTILLAAHDCTVPAAISDQAKIRSAADLARASESPEDIGSFSLILDESNKATQELPASVPSLIDIFDKPVKLDSKSQLLTEKAPSTKDASNYYVNLNYAAGKGSKPGWVLDAKISPTVGRLVHGYQFIPSAVADIGGNQIPNLKYTDTMNFGAAFSHMYQPNHLLQGLLFKPGFVYETDREFDRNNIVATVDLQYRFVNLFNPRQRRGAAKFANELKIAEARKIPWTRSNSRPVLFGYALDFHTGVEIGGALKDTVVGASVGNATLPLPTYHIARVVPQVHGLFEMGRFSVDAIGTPRYLATVENTVLERNDHSLFLKRLHGWSAFGIITGSWSFDPAGHVSFTVAYKNGFSPPKFSRVNTVQSGIAIKY